MNAVVFYEMSPSGLDKVMDVFPRHKLLVDAFVSQGKIIGIGAYADPMEGSLGIFIDRQAAEDFVSQDPFVLEGVVGKNTIRDWKNILYHEL